MIRFQVPENEDEQHRVRGQAQSLMDCVADLIEHCGVRGAYDLLYDGAQLERSASTMSRSSSDGWKIIGSLPAHAGEGVQIKGHQHHI